MAIGLVNDFKKDPGLNKKAKVIHTVMLSILMLFFAGSIANLVSLIEHFENINLYFSNDIGIIPGELSLVLYYVNILYLLTVLAFSFLLINRKNNARIRLMYLLPFWVFLYLINYYRTVADREEHLVMVHIVDLLPGIIVMGATAIVYIKIYTSQFMKAFFGKL